MRRQNIKATRQPNLIAAALTVVLAITTVRAEANTPAETRAIAEEGFIYGRSIVMNYAVMYQFCVDKTSAQNKGPVNRIANEDRGAFILPPGDGTWNPLGIVSVP